MYRTISGFFREQYVVAVTLNTEKDDSVIYCSRTTIFFFFSRHSISPFQCFIHFQFLGYRPVDWAITGSSLSRAGGLRFISRAGQIGHNITNGSPPVKHLFERSWLARALRRVDEPSKLITRFSVIQRVPSRMKDLIWLFRSLNQFCSMFRIDGVISKWFIACSFSTLKFRFSIPI